jgi:2-oxoglutarate dehydrogenase E2 component (dihydrolipoamide succinyltransferase)
MAISVEVPELGESVTEAIIANWVKQEGDYVEQDEVIAELDTDKISVEVTAPEAGVISSLKYDIDAEVGVGEVIAEIDTDAEAPDSPQETDDTDEASDTESADNVDTNEVDADTDKADQPDVDLDAAELSPSVRRLVEEHDLDPADISGSGPDGRITKGDVLAHIDGETDESTTEQRTTEPVGPTVDAEPQQREERVKMSSLRQTVAKKLVNAQQDTAMLTTFNEADMSAVMDLRDKYKDKFNEEYGIKLGFMSFFVKAAIEALKEYPAVNAQIDGKEIVYKNYYNIGVAVGGPDGLVVPVVNQADQLSFANTEKKIADLASKAQNKKLSLDQLQGGTFTISNGGIYGSMMSTPILNPPQSAILGMHNIVERPVAEDGEVVIRPIMYLALSYDHRIIDGKEAVSFLRRIKECIEEPERMLLEI